MTKTKKTNKEIQDLCFLAVHLLLYTHVSSLCFRSNLKRTPKLIFSTIFIYANSNLRRWFFTNSAKTPRRIVTSKVVPRTFHMIAHKSAKLVFVWWLSTVPVVKIQRCSVVPLETVQITGNRLQPNGSVLT